MPEDEVDIETVHIMYPVGDSWVCKISVNGQGHLPCGEHKACFCHQRGDELHVWDTEKGCTFPRKANKT